MADLKQTVSLTSVNSENMSRHQMLEWVNTMVNGHFKKIEELCSGVAYCQMMEMIFPNCINIKRVKMSAKLEHECFHNMKLFQGSLTRLKLDKTIPVDRLIKGRFQDNFEFLQWFKKFFDSQAPGLENIKSAANAVQPKPIKPRAMIPKDESSCDLRATIEELNQKTIDVMDKRDRAYEKLRQIEVLLTETINRNEHVTFCNRVCEVLYKTDQDENSADRQEIVLEDVDDMNMGMY
ncbi:hypothetical protein ACLKA7_013109 [Drosophila subpalustris]